MTLVAQILTLVLVMQAIREIINMEEPVVNNYESFIAVETREEMGTVHF